MSAVRRFVDVVGRPIDAAACRRAGVVALIYHRVGQRSPSAVDLSIDVFTAQLDAVADRVVDLDTAVASLAGDGVLRHGEPLVVLTFDDGTADWPDVVLPALVERRLPAVFYVSTDFVERGRPFPDAGRPVTWSGLSRDGVDRAGHRRFAHPHPPCAGRHLGRTRPATSWTGPSA